MRGMNLKDRIQKVIDQRRKQLIKERDEYERKMHDTVSYYGLGGAYRRQEAARDKTLAGILYHTEAQQQQCSEVVTKKMK